MQGDMKDIAGRVWTWMSMQDAPRNICQVMAGIEYFKYDEVLEALRWWVKQKEMVCHRSVPVTYEIINRKDPGDGDNG